MGNKFSKKENKLMARLLALVLCAVLLCGLGVTAFAADVEDEEVVEEPKVEVEEIVEEAEEPVVEDSKGPWTVKFNIGDEAVAAGVTAPESLVVNDGDEITLPAMKTFMVDGVGHIFGGWLAEDETLYKANETVVVSSDLTLTAQWTLRDDAPVKATSCTVTFNPNVPTGVSITVTPDKKTVSRYGKVGDLPTLSSTTYKSGGATYTFGGWYTSKTGGSEITTRTTVTENTTYYAHWTKVTYNNYTFNHVEIAVKMNATFVYNGKEYTAAITVNTATAQNYFRQGKLKLYSYTESAGYGSKAEVTGCTVRAGDGDRFGNTTFEFYKNSFNTGTFDDPIHYVAQLTIDVEFTAADGSKYTAPVTFEVDTHFWDFDNNACPGCYSNNQPRSAWLNGGNPGSGAGIDVTFGAASGKKDDTGDIYITKQVEGYTFTAGTVFSFTVTDKNDSTKVYTVNATLDNNGTGLAVKLGAPYGTYVISEVSAVTPDGYSLVTTYEPQEVTLSSTQETATATVKNIYSREADPDAGYIIVRKVFEGITKDQIPADFKITVQNNAGGSAYELTAANKATEVVTNDSITWTWNIPNAKVGSYAVNETGAAVEGFDLQTEGTGADIKIEAGKFEVNAERITTQSSNIYDVYVDDSTNVLFAARLTSGYVVVISQKQLTASQRANIEAAFTKMSSSWKPDTNIYDYYSFEVHGNEFNVHGADITYNPTAKKMTIQATSQWNQVAKASYAITPASTADISVTNTYTPNVTDVTIKKIVTGNLGDVNKKFQFYVQGDENHTLPGDPAPKDNKIGFQLSNGEEYKLEGVQVGTTLTIWEEGADGYIVKYDGNVLPSGQSYYSVTVEDSTAVTVTVTNIKDEIPDTGISLDSIPYILILVGVVAVGAVMVIKKRRDAYDA